MFGFNGEAPLREYVATYLAGCKNDSEKIDYLFNFAILMWMRVNELNAKVREQGKDLHTKAPTVELLPGGHLCPLD
jgi:hypothetical protein